jgi:replicative DNA helicase
MAAYSARAQAARTGTGVVSTGFPELDEVLGGGQQPGEMNIIAAWTNAGKTSFVTATAHHASVVQGKNVVMFTSETLRSQVRFKLVARHSRYLAEVTPGWPPHLARGINSAKIKSGRLSAEELGVLRMSVHSLARAPGRCYVAQVPRGASISTVESRIARISRMFPVDYVIIDYVALLRAETKRQSKREELSEIVTGTKQLAATYDGGRGVPVISPWQMNREGWKAAQTRGFYTTSDLAETAESASTADNIFTLLSVQDDPAGRNVHVNLQNIKARDGARLASPLELTADFATCWFSPRDSVVAAPGLGIMDSDEAPA